MAVGFPTKTTYANGDVFSASDINDTNGTLNLVNPATTPTVQANPLLNSAMQVWQRGTSVSIAASTIAYSADRWQVLTGANQATTVSRQATSDTTNLPSIQYCARFQRNSGQTGTTNYFFANSFETINSIPYAGKTVTVSFYARKGANYTAASDGLFVGLNTATGTDQNVFNYAVGVASPIGSTVTLTSTWQRFTVSGTLSASLNELAVFFRYTPVGTASTNDYFEVTGVQIDIGSVALPFRTNGATIQGELAACQRYYYLAVSGTGQAISMGANYTASVLVAYVNFPVTMRIAPTLAASSGTNYYGFDRNGALDTFNSLNLVSPSTNGTELFNSTEISGTVGHGGIVVTNNASASLAFTAEL
jgi:hypothetical protein